MKIVIATSHFPPYALGGGEYSAEELCRRLAQRGYEVIVTCPSPNGAAAVEPRDGYSVRWFIGDMTQAILRAAEGADVIHAQNWDAYESCIQAAREVGARAVGTVRDMSPFCSGICMMENPAEIPTPCANLAESFLCSIKTMRRSERRVSVWRAGRRAASFWRTRHAARSGLARLDAIVAVSGAMARLLKREGPAWSHKVHPIYNLPKEVKLLGEAAAAELRERFALSGGPYFIVAGKRSFGKGTARAVRAAAALCSRHPSARLAFFGRGEALESGPAVVNGPYLTQAELHTLMSHAEAVVVPSVYFEPISRAALDALVLGVPIVTSDAGGTKEAVRHGLNGLVYPKLDEAALAQSLCRITEEGMSLRDRARTTSRELLSGPFRAEAIMDQLVRLYAGKPVEAYR